MMIEHDVMEYSVMYELYMALSRDERIMKKETECRYEEQKEK